MLCQLSPEALKFNVHVHVYTCIYSHVLCTPANLLKILQVLSVQLLDCILELLGFLDETGRVLEASLDAPQLCPQVSHHLPHLPDLPVLGRDLQLPLLQVQVERGDVSAGHAQLLFHL